MLFNNPEIEAEPYQIIFKRNMSETARDFFMMFLDEQLPQNAVNSSILKFDCEDTFIIIDCEEEDQPIQLSHTVYSFPQDQKYYYIVLGELGKGGEAKVYDISLQLYKARKKNAVDIFTENKPTALKISHKVIFTALEFNQIRNQNIQTNPRNKYFKYNELLRSMQNDSYFNQVLYGQGDFLGTMATLQQSNDIELQAFSMLRKHEGCSLYTFLDKHCKNYNFIQRYQFALETILSICHLHNVKFIVHGDLKPANLILTKQYQVLPIDFTYSAYSYIPQIILGYTPTYGAPECFNINKSNINYSIDIFSLGGIIYDLLYGDNCIYKLANQHWKKIYSENKIEFIKIKLEQGFPPLENVTAMIDIELRNTSLSVFLEKMIAIAPAERPDAFTVYQFFWENNPLFQKAFVQISYILQNLHRYVIDFNTILTTIKIKNWNFSPRGLYLAELNLFIMGLQELKEELKSIKQIFQYHQQMQTYSQWHHKLIQLARNHPDYEPLMRSPLSLVPEPTRHHRSKSPYNFYAASASFDTFFYQRVQKPHLLAESNTPADDKQDRPLKH